MGNCAWFRVEIARFEKSPVVRLLVLFVHSFLPSSFTSRNHIIPLLSLNFRILILTQVFTLNSHLSHASYNFIAISFGKTLANDNIIWIIDKIYYGSDRLFVDSYEELLDNDDQHLNEERECRKRVEAIFSRSIDVNFEKELLITILMFLKSLCTGFPTDQYLSKSLWWRRTG